MSPSVREKMEDLGTNYRVRTKQQQKSTGISFNEPQSKVYSKSSQYIPRSLII